MSYYEIINSFKESLTLDTKENCLEAEQTLTDIICECVRGTMVNNSLYGFGMVRDVTGESFENIKISIEFSQGTKILSLFHIMTTISGRFTKFNNPEVYDIWADAFELYTEINRQYKEIDRTERQLAIEAAKKAEADRKAEIRYQKAKEKAIADFEKLANREKTTTYVDEFYYALGWLVAHAGTISAALPDYLETAFTQAFGAETPCRVVDSKKKTPAGWQAQWSWSFKVSLKKPESIPVILTKYLNPKGDAISNTSFIWDLIEDFGFKFGKKQDVSKIEENIPVDYFEMFQAGLLA